MEPTTRPPYNASAAWLLLSEAFRYPRKGQLAALAGGLDDLPEGPARQLFSEFLGQTGSLSLGQWEELYTRTFDLNPPAAPYIGYQIWGDSYRRGEFMAALSGAQAEAGVPASGELPDHLVPALRYLGGMAAARLAPLPALVSALEPAVERMAEALCKAEPENPYGRLLASLQAVSRQSLPKEAA